MLFVRSEWLAILSQWEGTALSRNFFTVGLIALYSHVSYTLQKYYDFDLGSRSEMG